MNGMPTTPKDPIILSPGEIAVYKRNSILNECKKLGCAKFLIEKKESFLKEKALKNE